MNRGWKKIINKNNVLGRIAGVALTAMAATLLPVAAVHAAPEEIVVFTDEFEKPGEVGYELHFNYASRARRTSDYTGEQPPYHVFRFMPEVVWGLSQHWNLGLHVPMSRNMTTGTASVDGIKLRLQYLDVKPLSKESHYYYGVNFEISSNDKRISEVGTTGEVRGIVGWRNPDWLVAVNPILNKPLNKVEGVDSAWGFDLFSKVMRNINKDLAFGIEHYSELGRAQRVRFGPESSQTTYLVSEFTLKSGMEVHVGVGHGWTNPVDKRVVKVLLGLPF